jgi:PAS domain S-box-containing protein
MSPLEGSGRGSPTPPVAAAARAIGAADHLEAPAVQAQGRIRSAWPRWLRPSFLPIPALLISMVAIQLTVDPSVFYDPVWLILLGNAIFLTGVSLVVSYVALRNYAATGRIQILLLGCGVLIFGIGGVLAAAVRSLPGGANLNVTIYNTGALLGGALHLVAAFFLLAGIAPEVGAARKRSWLFLGYAGSVALMILFASACLGGLVPPFFVQGVGPTALRQWVLGAADALFVFSAIVFMGTYLRTREVFLYWYACALALTAISLTAFFLQHSVGSPVGWLGRFSQYVGGVYFLASLGTAARSAHSRGTSLDTVLTSSLSGAEETFRALAENAPDVIRRFDRELRHIYVNPAGRRLYGKGAGAIVGKRMDEVGLADEQGRRWSARITEVFETGEPVDAEEYLPTEDGSRYYQSLCVPEYGPDGRVANVLVLSRDLTERRRVEEALQHSEARYRNLFQSITEEVHFWELVRDARGRIQTWRLVDVNPPTLASWKRTLEEIRGKTTDEIFGPGATEHYLPIVERIMREGVPYSYEDYFPNLDRYFRFTSIPLGDHFITTGADITDVKKALRQAEEQRAQLVEADRRKNEFLGMLSHELRNPLAPIRNAAYILRHAEPGTERTRRAQEVIERQAEHLTRLVDDLLDITRIAHGRIELRRSRVDLHEVVLRAANDFRVMLGDRGVAFLETLPGPRIRANVDATRVTQIVGNLLHNAAKFTRRGDEVALSLAVVDGAAEIRVRDTGAGIDPSLLPSIFDAFVQGERTLARTEGGLGLGLALVKGIAELHGGTVRAESAGIGKGSEFVVRLPLPDTLPREEPAARAERRHGARRVLVVDDNQDAAESLADLVRILGHAADVAFDGPTAVDMARVNPPDLVLCDIGLPGMSGYEVAKALRATAADGLQVIAVSGYAQPEDVKRAMEAGFDGHVAKPCDPEKIEQLLG